jgi:mannose-6-phosphate isomerase-like protein (cupin superfamily)
VTGGWKHMSVLDVEDAAEKFGFSETHETRFPHGDLEAQQTGFSFHRFKPGKRQPFAHRHDEAEEIYVVLSGGGRLKLDDEIIEIGPMDAIRMAPRVTRALEAGDDGLEILAFGPRHGGDGEIIEDFWGD